MKEFISTRLDALTELANALKPQYKHGLSISTRPRRELHAVQKGSVTFNGGEFFEHQFAPDDFAEVFTEDWFTKEDLLGLQTVIDIDTFIFAYPKGKVVIEQQNTSLGLFLIVEADTNITLQTSGVGTTRVHVLVKKGNATFTHVQNGQQIVHKNAHIKKGSMKWTDLIVTDQYIRSYVANTMIGVEAIGEIKSFSLTKGLGICDMYTENHHEAEHTKSDIVTRSVMSDNSKTLSRGLVSIGQKAAHSEGYEQQDALILSNDAEADAIPNLEIHNHDVKCSHGSTVGRVDEEKLFYLMARGVSETKAKNLIVRGYFLPAIHGIADEKVRTSVLEQLDVALE